MLLACFFMNFVFFGAVVILAGAAVPEILRTYSWRYVDMGAILAGGSIGYFVSTFLCGFLLRHWGPKRIIVYGLVFRPWDYPHLAKCLPFRVMQLHYS